MLTVDLRKGHRQAFYYATVDGEDTPLLSAPLTFRQSTHKGKSDGIEAWRRATAVCRGSADGIVPKGHKYEVLMGEFAAVEGQTRMVKGILTGKVGSERVRHQLGYAASEVAKDMDMLIDHLSNRVALTDPYAYAGRCGNPFINKGHSMYAIAPDGRRIKLSDSSLQKFGISLAEVRHTFGEGVFYTDL